MKKNLAVRSHENIMLVTINASNPSDSEWAEALTVGKAMLTQAGGDPGRTGALVFSDGGSPSARQRQLIRELYGANPPPMALVTDSLLARGAAAIFKVFWPSLNAIFGAKEWEAALRHVKLTAPERVAEHFKAMQGELGPIAVLQPFLERGPR